MTNKDTNIVENAVAEGGAYEVIRKRLITQGSELERLTRQLNEERLQEFGSADMSVLANTRIRTENNCIARDIVQVGSLLVFGYNVFIGLKQETRINDVFALFKLHQNEDSYEMQTVDLSTSFLSQQEFVNDFEELYRYYKHARLMQLTIAHGKLLAEFQTSKRREDIRVFRWSLSADGTELTYIDNRGERDIDLPPAYDYEWIETGRDDYVNGRFPHVNILDTIFVETIKGDLTIKIENNTEKGEGIYQESVVDQTQSLPDAKILYTPLGNLILLKILPYREEQWRYFIFNRLTHKVIRQDALGESCVQLPEDHGIIYPGGYYLQDGSSKSFTSNTKGLLFKRKIASPNGEDVLYVFYQPDEGIVALFAYNLISKELQNPLYGHGHALSEDGQLIIFSAEEEPARIHPMQIWQTPFFSEEFASRQTVSQNFYGRVGNVEMVRGISDLYSIQRLINNEQVSSLHYENLVDASLKIFDSYYWFNEPETKHLAGLLKEITATAELVVDEFEKFQSIQRNSTQALNDAQQQQEQILQEIHSGNWELAEQYVNALGRLRHLRGHLATISEYRYINTDKISELDEELIQEQDLLSQRTIDFLAQDNALSPYMDKINDINHQLEKSETALLLTPLIEQIEETSSGLDLMSELMSTLKVDDATVHTRIIDDISEVYAKLNQSRANATHKIKNLGLAEAKAQFAAQFKLFSQGITNALALANTPESSDEQLSRLLVQLEELESQFSQHNEFLVDILDKREEIQETFDAHKQELLDQRQTKAQSLYDAADRILANIERRSMKFTETDELNTYFAADALVMKIRELLVQLSELSFNVMTDDLDARLKAIKEQALRSLRDKLDIYEQGGQVIRLGPRHKFSVNIQELDLSIIPRKDKLYIHLSGTDFYQVIDNERLNSLQDYWSMSLVSESAKIYRSQYLAFQILKAAGQQQQNLDMKILNRAAMEEQSLQKIVQEFAHPRYKEGYERGVHDHDAALILQQ